MVGTPVTFGPAGEVQVRALSNSGFRSGAASSAGCQPPASTSAPSQASIDFVVMGQLARCSPAASTG